MPLANKIDFAVIFTVKNANPNGDPLNGNRPRENYDGFGEVSDVCIKRKIRNRFQDMGEKIFVQSQERSDDGADSLKKRADSVKELKDLARAKNGSSDKYTQIACKEWLDVRTFGQVFAFKKDLSLGIRGPVSIHPAFSVSPIQVDTLQITKSVNSKDDAGKASDTMGQKHRVSFGLYVFYGSINCFFAEKTGFSDEDSEKLHEALCTLFENDASSARPDGSMEVRNVYWWKHNSKSGQYPSAVVHRSLSIKPNTETPMAYEDYEITRQDLQGLQCFEKQF